MRPNFLSWLRHDRLLTKKNFPTFVDTFNYIVERIDKLKGDKDLDPQKGLISVDNTDPDHPVIRLDSTRLPKGGGGGGGGGAFSYDPDTHTIKDGMYLRARKWTTVADATVSAQGYAYLQIPMGTSGTATIVTGASSVPNPTQYEMCVPLYQFDEDLNITHDYRGAPTAQIWEYT